MRGNVRSSIGFLAVLLMGLLSADARSLEAAVLYTNLGPADSFALEDSWAVSGKAAGNGVSSVGLQFVPTESGNVGSIDVGFYQDEDGSASDIIFELRANQPGDFPDFGASALDVLILPGSSVQLLPAALYNVASTKFPFLNAGTSYWLIASTSGNAFYHWNQTSPAVGGNLYEDLTEDSPGNGTVSSQILPTLRINAVPEPSTLGLGAIALGFLIAYRRNLRR